MQTSIALHAFFVAMMIYPEVQARAQAELDSIVGSDRLPTLDDRARLPYTVALMKEVLRWSPPSGLGEEVYSNS
jgi:cytochrome P450